ncbi:MAG: radical SAM protein [Planctomycetota bacterium]
MWRDDDAGDDLMGHRYGYLFGPVPSRRLGRSLGVDLTPYKTCSFDCVFCQLGRTTNKTLARKEYVPTSAVIQELRDWIETVGNADVITLSGSGEPTLHSSFAEVIDCVQSSTSVPVALLTNGSLLGDKAVREAAGRANIVKVSLSAWDQLSFKRINRPHPKLNLKDLVDGARALRETLAGELWIEVFIVRGMNDAEKDVGKIAELVKSIQPDRIQLNTAVRPPAEEFVQAAPSEELAQLAAFFDPIAEVTAEFSSEQSPSIQANENTILEMLERRPCTAEQIAAVFGMHGNEVSKYLGKLTRTGRIRAKQEGGHTYYVTRAERGQHVQR